MKKRGIDLHTHTTVSDGALRPEELIALAIEKEYRVLAITDHNRLLPDFEKYKKLAEPKLCLVRGTEVGCEYTMSTGTVASLHVVVLVPEDTEDITPLNRLLDKNGPKVREAYINRMLDALRVVGCDLGTYRDLCEELGVEYIGKSQVVKAMVKCGFVKDEQEALDVYVGDFGERRAWVAKDNRIGLEELIQVVHQVHGIPILAHLYYYGLTDEENLEVLKVFRRLTGAIGCMETDYGHYDEIQRKQLREFAEQYDLMESAGSDFHGVYEDDRLEEHFDYSKYERMIVRWKEFYHISRGYYGLDFGKTYPLPEGKVFRDEEGAKHLESLCATDEETIVKSNVED